MVYDHWKLTILVIYDPEWKIYQHSGTILVGFTVLLECTILPEKYLVWNRGAHQVWPAYQNLEFWFHFFRENIFKIFSDFAKSEKYFFLFFWLQKNEVRNKKYFISDFGKWSQKNIKKYFFWFGEVRIIFIFIFLISFFPNQNFNSDFKYHSQSDVGKSRPDLNLVQIIWTKPSRFFSGPDRNLDFVWTKIFFSRFVQTESRLKSGKCLDQMKTRF